MTVTDDSLDSTPEGIGDPILDLLNGFIVQLRAAGLPVSLTENLDAMQAVKHVPLEDRQTFKYALAATLVKHHNHWKAFETVFEVYFSLRGDEYQIGDDAVELPEMDDDDQQGDQQGRGEMAKFFTFFVEKFLQKIFLLILHHIRLVNRLLKISHSLENLEKATKNLNFGITEFNTKMRGRTNFFGAYP